MGNLIDYIFIVPAALIAIILHELAHGLVSYWLGDPTPKRQGRLSLNPLKHIDWIGALCLVVFKFGWAKPVQVNTRYFNNPKRDMAITALAGPVSNILMGFLFLIRFLFPYYRYSLINCL